MYRLLHATRYAAMCLANIWHLKTDFQLDRCDCIDQVISAQEALTLGSVLGSRVCWTCW
jgi:hypothetical protein